MSIIRKEEAAPGRKEGNGLGRSNRPIEGLQ